MNDYGTDDNNPDEPRGQERWFEEAAGRVKIPGTLLQLFGGLIVMLSVLYGTMCVINPEGMVKAYYEWVEEQQEKQPVEQRQKLPPREESLQSIKIQGPIYGIVGTIMGVLTFVGGSKMKQLRGYALAMIGSIVSILPGFCCCCIGAVPGIWALIVLLNGDVKLAFSRVAASGRGIEQGE